MQTAQQLGDHSLDLLACIDRHARTQKAGGPTRPFAVRWRALKELLREVGRSAVATFGSDPTYHRSGYEAEDLRRAQQTQKLAALGQMASGIAHDFNNALQAAMLTLDMAEKRLGQHRPAECRRLLAIAAASLKQASASSARLLAFASPRQDAPRPVDVNTVLDGLQDLLRSALGPAVKLHLVPAANLPSLVCDANELESALLNLAINGRDAMPDGGTLTISSHRATLERTVGGLEPGCYVALEIADTGCGMEPETARRACEPFFTTKPAGRGTGLGLAMVKSFVEKHRGRIELESAPGRGTTIQIYLPALA